MLARNSDFPFHVVCHGVVDRLVVVVLLVPRYRVGEVGIRQKRGDPAVGAKPWSWRSRRHDDAVVVTMPWSWQSRRRGEVVVEAVVLAKPPSWQSRRGGEAVFVVSSLL